MIWLFIVLQTYHAHQLALDQKRLNTGGQCFNFAPLSAICILKKHPLNPLMASCFAFASVISMRQTFAQSHQTLVISPGSVGSILRAVLYLLFFPLTVSCSDFYLSWERVSNISGGTEGSIFMTLRGECWGFCAAKVAFSSTACRLFSSQFLLGVCAVALWRRCMEVGAFVTFKRLSAILVKTISLIVTYTGDSVALPAGLDHQNWMKQRSGDI